FRIGRRIERGLDVRQRDELARDAVRVEHLVDVISPDAGANQPGLETIRLPELKAQSVRGGTKLRIRRALGEELEHALLFRAQALSRAVAELRQDRAISFDGGAN